ncbi:MAG TPA: hypothetical protein EYP16_05155, partial [Candidatus Atribacteria bacterium]|nr:hypothetical protein [Candidatus Atribacteria bacterium]
MRVFLDPWDVEYTSFFQVEEETLGAKVKLDIELPEEKWAPISVEGAFSQKEIVFIDGIRKMHQRVVVESDGGIFFGGFGTYVAGAIKLNIGKENRISNSLVAISIKRVLVLPEGIVKNVRSSYQVPKIPFPFELRSSSENDSLSSNLISSWSFFKGESGSFSEEDLNSN